MEKRNKVIYWVSTGLFSVMILMGAVMYFVSHQMVQEAYISLGYPTYLIYPLGVAKFLGVAALLIRKFPFITELAYAGFFYLLILGLAAHLYVADGGFAPSLIALVLLLISYCSGKRVYA